MIALERPDMARIRSIKPEMADDAKLASVSREARYTFVLLISKADDDGLVSGAHRQLLGLLYPHDDDVTVPMVLGWLEELVSIGAVLWRATRDGVPVVELANWAKHQRIDNKGRNTLRGMLQELSSPNLAESRGDSPNLAESRGLEGDRDREVEVGGGEGGGEGKGTQKKTHSRAARAAERAKTTLGDFADAWAMYPRRAGANSRRDAERAWLARVKAGSPTTAMLAGLRRYRAFCEHEQQTGTRYVMQASRFFGPDRPFDEAWDVSVPADDIQSALEQRAAGEREAAERDEVWLDARKAAMAAGVGA
jgi:hypothetical protein